MDQVADILVHRGDQVVLDQVVARVRANASAAADAQRALRAELGS